MKIMKLALAVGTALVLCQPGPPASAQTRTGKVVRQSRERISRPGARGEALLGFLHRPAVSLPARGRPRRSLRSAGGAGDTLRQSGDDASILGLVRTPGYDRAA